MCNARVNICSWTVVVPICGTPPILRAPPPPNTMSDRYAYDGWQYSTAFHLLYIYLQHLLDTHTVNGEVHFTRYKFRFSFTLFDNSKVYYIICRARCNGYSFVVTWVQLFCQPYGLCAVSVSLVFCMVKTCLSAVRYILFWQLMFLVKCYYCYENTYIAY